MFLFFILALFLFSCQQRDGKRIVVDCPSEKKVLEVLKRYAPNADIKVESIRQFENTGLCEVFFRLGVQPAVMYVDQDLSHMFPAVISSKTGENLSIKKINENRTIPKDILKKFEERTTYRLGKGEEYVYFIAEPNNEDVEESYRILQKLAKERGIEIRVIIRPDKLNSTGYEIALSSLCDKKSFEDMLKGYNTKRSCEEGRKTLDENIKFVEERMNLPYKNPIIITSKGKLFVGRLTEDVAQNILNGG